MKRGKQREAEGKKKEAEVKRGKHRHISYSYNPGTNINSTYIVLMYYSAQSTYF